MDNKMKLTRRIAEALLAFMPPPILADLYEDETGEDAAFIRELKHRFDRQECCEVLWGKEVKRLDSLSLVNFIKEVRSNKVTDEEYVRYMLGKIDPDKRLAYRIMIGVVVPPQRVRRKDYEVLLKIYQTLGMRSKVRDLKLSSRMG